MQDDEPQACAFCTRYADHACSRCGRAYCDAHGDDLCQLCLDPAGSLPSGRFFRGSMVALAITAVAGLLILFISPSLPGERRLAKAVAQNPANVSPANRTSGQPAQRSGTGRSVVPTPLPAASPTAPSLRSYTVVLNDTLSGIAESFGTTVAAIQAANPGVGPANLKPGQELLIPPPEGTPQASASPTPASSLSPTPTP